MSVMRCGTDCESDCIIASDRSHQTCGFQSFKYGVDAMNLQLTTLKGRFPALGAIDNTQNCFA